MGVRLLWTTGAAKEALYVARITRILQQEYSTQSVILSGFGSSKRALKGVGVSCLGLDNIWAQAKASLPDSANEQIQEANKLLRGIDINLLIHGDSLLYLLDDREAARVFTARTVLAISHFIRDSSFTLCIHYGGDFLGNIIGLLPESMPLRVYTLASGVPWDHCVLLDSGLKEQWTWAGFSKNWDMRKGHSIPVTQKERIDKRIAALHESHKMRPRTRVQQFGLVGQGSLFHLARRLLKPMRDQLILRQKSPAELLTCADLEVLAPLWERYVYRLQSKWLRTYPQFAYDDIPERYIYMPLNQPWDTPHRQWNPMNYLQVYIAKIAQASLPFGYELVIKEHPYTYGDPSHQELRELQRLGIRVIDPHVHSHELIKRAAAVFCVGDTTGWEAILFKTPVVLYGASPFYMAYPSVLRVSDPNEVHHVLREAVRCGRAAYQNEDLWYSFLFSAFESCYPGNIWAYKGLLWSDPDDSDGNVRHIAAMIAKEANL